MSGPWVSYLSTREDKNSSRNVASISDARRDTSAGGSNSERAHFIAKRNRSLHFRWN